MKTKSVVILFCLFVLCSVVDLIGAEDESVSIGEVEKGVAIFDTDKDGSRIWELHGSSARFLDDGFIEINDLELIFYGKSSDKNEVVIRSSKAQMNQSSKLVRTDQVVNIVSGDMDVTGKGLDGDMSSKIVHLKSNVKVILIGTAQGGLFFRDE